MADAVDPVVWLVRLGLVKEDFKQTIRAGSGQLAAEAKREEYERLMRQKKTPPAEANEVPETLPAEADEVPIQL